MNKVINTNILRRAYVRGDPGYGYIVIPGYENLCIQGNHPLFNDIEDEDYCRITLRERKGEEPEIFSVES